MHREEPGIVGPAFSRCVTRRPRERLKLRDVVLARILGMDGFVGAKF
jgi:hypothetical protein